MPEQNCPFCNLDTERNRVIDDSRENVVVILSNPRLMPGHTLVIPKRHVGRLCDLGSVERDALFDAAVYYQEKIKRVFSELWGKPAGCDLSQHDRVFMPTTQLSIPQHVHIHLRPRYWQDPYYDRVLRHETAVFQKPTSEELAEHCKLLAG